MCKLPREQITGTAPRVGEELFIKLLHPLSNGMSHQNRLIRGEKMLWAVFKFPTKHIFVLAMEYLITR